MYDYLRLLIMRYINLQTGHLGQRLHRLFCTVLAGRFLRQLPIAALLLLPLAACRDNANPPTQEIAPYSIPAQPDIASLQAAMTAGQLSAVTLTQHYLNRIGELNPELLAVVEINPQALELAAALDAERAAGRIRSPLHGIPVLLKDNIDTADAMQTTAGSLALMDAPTPARDAFVVQKLRDSGAVILGKTNLSEWANFRSTQSSSGWSARGGQTRNAHNPAITPCGSSSGSGVAVAADLAVLAVGTETDGSIICPAANNGIVGIKPTLGLISRSGIIPIAHSQDTAGPMARTVADAATMLSAMTGFDPADAVTGLHNIPYTDYRFALRSGGLQGKRIGVMRHLFGRNAQVDALMQQSLQVLRDAGATLIDVNPQIPPELADAEYQVLLYEFKFGLNRYLSARGGQYLSLSDLIAFNEANAAQEMPHFGQEIFIDAQTRGDLSSPAYLEALRFSKMTSQGIIDELIRSDGLDALLAPSNGPGWPIDLENGDNPGAVNYVSSSGLAAISGYPSITVPAGRIDGLPVGISLMGTAFSEPELITLAYDFEQQLKSGNKAGE